MTLALAAMKMAAVRRRPVGRCGLGREAPSESAATASVGAVAAGHDEGEDLAPKRSSEGPQVGTTLAPLAKARF